MERARVRGWLGPIGTALVLGVATIPIVAWAIANPTLPGSFSRAGYPIDETLPIAVVAVVAASLAGGFVGGRLKRRATLSIFVALAVAWFVGMVSLSVAPALLRIEYVGAVICFDSCQPLVTDANPLSGAFAWGAGLGVSTSMAVPPLVAGVLLIVSRRLMRRGSLVPGATLIVAAHAVAQWITFAGGGVPAIAAYACLGIGVVIWAVVVVPVRVQPSIPIEPVVVPSPA